MNLDQLLTHLKKLATSLSAKQILGLGAVFIAVVGVVVGSAYWISTPNYALLVADMDAETATSVVSKLKDGKVPYELADGGRTVRVPAERVDELRLQFASGGLPSAGRIGFEIFDRPAFGTTEFLEHINYRRALEGELARTIGTLSEVASARVHIAMGKDSLFVDQAQPAKASVVLRLKANRPLMPATVNGIAGLVASSVESLRPESVVIIDTFGRPLTRSNDEGDTLTGVGAQFDKQQQIERDLSQRVVSLLEPVVGPGRVRVNIAAFLRSDVVEQTEEVWDTNPVIRSRQTSTETGSAFSSTGGVAGARANQPPQLSTGKPAATSASTTATAATAPAATPPPPGTTPPAPGATPPVTPAAATAPGVTATPPVPTPTSSTPVAGVLPAGPGRTSEITNYEIGKVTRHTMRPQGQLARLSVAVILDDERVAPRAETASAATPDPAGAAPAAAAVTSPVGTTKAWDQAEIQRIHNLVAAAVGLDTTRGDQLTVENIAFDAAPEEDALPAAPGIGVQTMDFAKRNWSSALRYTAIMAIAMFALTGILRPLARRAMSLPSMPALPAAAGGGARLPTVQEMEGQIEGRAANAAGATAQNPLPALTRRVAKLANDEPEQLARIVRGWMAEEER